MSITAIGFAKCEKPARYIQQLIKHWSHKFETAYADGTGAVPFSDTNRATFTAAANGIEIRLETSDSESNQRLRSVIESHIDRFAFREAPLQYEWSEA